MEIISLPIYIIAAVGAVFLGIGFCLLLTQLIPIKWYDIKPVAWIILIFGGLIAGTLGTFLIDGNVTAKVKTLTAYAQKVDTERDKAKESEEEALAIAEELSEEKDKSGVYTFQMGNGHEVTLKFPEGEYEGESSFGDSVTIRYADKYEATYTDSGIKKGNPDAIKEKLKRMDYDMTRVTVKGQTTELGFKKIDTDVWQYEIYEDIGETNLLQITIKDWTKIHHEGIQPEEVIFGNPDLVLTSEEEAEEMQKAAITEETTQEAVQEAKEESAAEAVEETTVETSEITEIEEDAEPTEEVAETVTEVKDTKDEAAMVTVNEKSEQVTELEPVKDPEVPAEFEAIRDMAAKAVSRFWYVSTK